MVTVTTRRSSPRREELLERAYSYVLEHGLPELSLRPLTAAIGSSPRVLLFLFGSKDGLLAALLAKARADELAALADATAGQDGLPALVAATWRWLSAQPVRPLLTLWTQAYALSLTDPDGPWAGFAARTVSDWLDVLGTGLGPAAGAAAGPADRTLALAVLRGCLLDLLATGDQDRTAAAVERYLSATEGTETQRNVLADD